MGGKQTTASASNSDTIEKIVKLIDQNIMQFEQCYDDYGIIRVKGTDGKVILKLMLGWDVNGNKYDFIASPPSQAPNFAGVCTLNKRDNECSKKFTVLEVVRPEVDGPYFQTLRLLAEDIYALIASNTASTVDFDSSPDKKFTMPFKGEAAYTLVAAGGRGRRKRRST